MKWKKSLSVLLVIALLVSLLSATAFAADKNDAAVFLKQPSGSKTCTLYSAAMMLRRRAILEGNGNWANITADAMYSTAWSGGLRWNFKYAGISVTTASFGGTVAEKKNKLISMLNSHPEGIEIYTYGDNVKWHAVLLLDYTGGIFYVADPAPGAASGRLPLTSAYFNGGTQDERIGWIKQIWYVTGGNCDIPTPPAPAPVQHTHGWSYYYESSHPHEQYRTCSCGAKEYTGVKKTVTNCKSCYPLGNVTLTRSFDRVSGAAAFYRNSVSNANSYSLTISRSSSEYGSYSTYKTATMSSTSYNITLPQGYYYQATLTAKNTNTGESRSATCDRFRIYNTYAVSYNANGGSGAPSSQTKIQDTNLTLSSVKPSKAHYLFQGWSKNKTAAEVSYLPGGIYDKNAKITLYAVWEPETYTVSYDLNGGKGEAPAATITYGDTLKMPNTVVKDGYYLKGWAKSKTATAADYKIGIDYAIDSNLALYAVWGNAMWSGAVASSFAGGDGSRENPYRISNASELAYLAKSVNAQTSAPTYRYYQLTDNINMGYEEWVPIGLGGNENQYFYGSFDGNGFTISDLSISDANEGYAGLFGKVQESEIKGLNLAGDISGIATSSQLYAGAVAGMATDSEIHDCYAMYVNVSDLAASTSATSAVSCMVGYLSGGHFTDNTAQDCYVFLKTGKFNAGIMAGYSDTDLENCTVRSEADELFGTNASIGAFDFGGIVGYSAKSIKKCSVNAAYLSNTIKTTAESNIGGIAGRSLGKIELCSVVFTEGASRTVDGETRSISVYASGSGDQTIGGIAGKAESGCAIADCKYNGQSVAATTTGGNATVGGLVGAASAALSRSFAYTEGTIFANANQNAKAGGTVGEAAKQIKLGDYLVMGSYYGQPILWRCVSFEKITSYLSDGTPVMDATNTRTTYADGYLPLMMADRIICLKPFDASGTNTSGSHGRGYNLNGRPGYYRRSWGSNYWGDSNLRCWLNSQASAGNVVWTCGNPPDNAHAWNGNNDYADEAGFLTHFNTSELAAIQSVRHKVLLDGYEYSGNVRNSNYHRYNNSISNVVQNYATAYSEQMTDRVFLPDVKQINTVYLNRSTLGSEYYIGIPTAEAVANSEYTSSSLTPTTKWWSWLGSPNACDNDSHWVREVSSDGVVGRGEADGGSGGVRPAFYLNFSSLALGGDGSESVPYTLEEQEDSRNLLSVADRVSAASSSSSYQAMSGDIAGSVSHVGFSDVYSYSGMDLSAVNSANSANAVTETRGASRTLTQIKRESFLNTVFGPTPYRSLAYLATDPTAVWVVKNGELPELYYNVLNDIRISDEIEDGTVTLDKTQAVDGEIVTVTANPNEGYELNKIYVNGAEIVGNTFEVNGNTTVYALFLPKPQEYTATVQATSNATASLINADKSGSLMLMSVADEITATDGDEIRISAAADRNYNIDAILVNGEEIAGNSFVIDENATITLEVSDLSTEIAAVTGEAVNISDYFATISGSISSKDPNVSKYMRYWKESDPSTVFTTEVETGTGEYTANIYPLEAKTTYCYQMTENGEVRRFTTLEAEPGPVVEEKKSQPITETTVKSLASSYKFNITADRELLDEMVIVAVYSDEDKVLDLKITTFDGDSEGTVSIPKQSGISYAKVFVWDDKLCPLGGVERIDSGF